MIKEKEAIILIVGEGFKEGWLGGAGGRKGCDSISIKNIFKIKFYNKKLPVWFFFF